MFPPLEMGAEKAIPFLLQVHLVERIPFFDALYFVTTTLTTVGYGDVVAISPLGKAAVLAMILVGVVLIPVQTSQLYSQLTARRLTLGDIFFFPANLKFRWLASHPCQVLGMCLVGHSLIPAQTPQLHLQLTALCVRAAVD